MGLRYPHDEIPREELFTARELRAIAEAVPCFRAANVKTKIGDRYAGPTADEVLARYGITGRYERGPIRYSHITTELVNQAKGGGRQRHRHTAAERAAARKLSKLGASVADVARALDRSYGSVHKLMKRMGLNTARRR